MMNYNQAKPKNHLTQIKPNNPTKTNQSPTNPANPTQNQANQKKPSQINHPKKNKPNQAKSTTQKRTSQTKERTSQTKKINQSPPPKINIILLFLFVCVLINTMEIIILGSAGSTPTKERALPSVALKYDGDVYLFDCGEGTQRQMMINDVKYGKVKTIFISHLHVDHILGIYGLLETYRLNDRTSILTIIGPDISSLFNPRTVKKYPFLNLIDIKQNRKVYETDSFIVSAFRTYHNIISYGFLLEEKERVKFKQPLCKKLGIKGIMYKEIERKGQIKINNKIIKLSDVTYKVSGRKFAYLGDTIPHKKIIEKIKDVDLLIADSTFSKEHADIAKERMHSTAEQAAWMAKQAQVKELILTHISQRYKDPSVLVNEAKKIFNNTLCAWDGLRIKIPKHILNKKINRIGKGKKD